MTGPSANLVQSRESLLIALQKAAAGKTPEDRIRAVLTAVVPGAGLPQMTVVDEDPCCCPNCGTPTESERTPYCCEECRDMAAFIRQFRSSVENGSIFEPDRQVALGQALWRLQGGGYPYRQTLIPAKTIAKVIERDGGKCTICGAPATGVDHTGSG